MQDYRKEILILANARQKGGLSGGDAIYESFMKHWHNCNFTVKTMIDIDFKPMAVCYAWRIILACVRAIFDKKQYDLVYSASDFLMDSLPAYIYSRKGNRWLAGFFLKAEPNSTIHYKTQKHVYKLIQKNADMVCVTNPTMETLFPDNPTTWINGGIDLKLAGISEEEKEFDAVFCGRFHYTKGIRELIYVWQAVKKEIPTAKLALIGDGDIGKEAIKKQIKTLQWNGGDSGIKFFGFMGDERYEVYKKSKFVVYPVPPQYDHFSIAPVEAMACGCPMVTFDTPVNRYFEENLGMIGCAFVGNMPFHGVWAGMAVAIVDFIRNDSWKEYVLDARDWSIKFDYQFQSLRVYNSVMGELFNESFDYWKQWNVGAGGATFPSET